MKNYGKCRTKFVLNTTMSHEIENSEQGDESDSNEAIFIPAKKAKRMCPYRAEWAVEFPWSSKAAGKEFVAKCSLCRKTISVANGGRGDLIQHENTESHMQAGGTKISAHIVKTNSVNDVDWQVCSQTELVDYISKAALKLVMTPLYTVEIV